MVFRSDEWRAFFDAEDGGGKGSGGSSGGGGGSSNQNATGGGGNDAGKNADGGGGNQNADGGGNTRTITLTQDELDRMIQDRLDRYDRSQKQKREKQGKRENMSDDEKAAHDLDHERTISAAAYVDAWGKHTLDGLTSPY
ncbi:MAG: hypothetical protein KBC96_02360 [Armatimonadetes bacterium]|nr:hypothetical protein [Armatimonadota bacterium]